MLQEEEKASIAKHNVETILDDEDDADNRELYTGVVALLTPHQVKVARNGSQALHFVQHIKPSLFLLEYRLPALDGIDLYDQLHSTPGLERIPAILMSGVSSEQLTDEVERRKLILMEKPFELNDVLSTIATVLSGWWSTHETHGAGGSVLDGPEQWQEVGA
jgi:CheY-like chemotaxis protein